MEIRNIEGMNIEAMTIAVIGIGGVGGYFGGKLTQLLSGETHLKIYFIARNQHLEEIKKNGLLLDSEEGQLICRPTLATSDISALPQLDICFICVKSYDLEKVLYQLKPKIEDKTIILPLLNGVDIYERIREVIPNGTIFPSCVYVGTHIEKPGKVTQRGGTCTIIFGKDPGKDMECPELIKILKSAGIKHNWMDNPYPEIWSKFIFITAFGLVTANFNKTIGQVLESRELRGYVKSIMEEITAIAHEKKIDLSPAVIDESFAKANKFPYTTKTSFQRDYEIMEKPDERDLFGGAIIRMGKQYNIKVETTRLIFDSLSQNKQI